MHPKMGLWATAAAPQPGIAWPFRGRHPAGSVLSWALGRGTWGRDPSWGQQMLLDGPSCVCLTRGGHHWGFCCLLCLVTRPHPAQDGLAQMLLL